MATTVATLTGNWSPAALKVLAERYLWRANGQLVEDADGMCRRVAAAVASAEQKWVPDPGERGRIEDAFLELMLQRKFIPNSPTLMNAGKQVGQQLAACFVLPVEDSLEGIFDAVKYSALIHKSGAGTGFSFSRLRPEGSSISSGRGVASGPHSFIRVFDVATEELKRGGVRRGANMGVLRVDHPDVLDFVDCKRQGGIANFNISIAATDRFMRALERPDDGYELLDPRDARPAGQLHAREVFDRMVDSAWLTGDPGLIFIDRVNASPAAPNHPRYSPRTWDDEAQRRIDLNFPWTDPQNPGVGIVESTNPCGEQPLLPYEACNLGSINLSSFAKNTLAGGHAHAVDWDALAETVYLGVRFLDDVIEISQYPLPQTADVVHRNRRIGLGVMGWADLLIELGIPYDSQEALALGGDMMAFINRNAHAASEKLAEQRGAFPNWDRSMYKDGAPLRNSTLTTIAPTGTISIVAGCSSGIEPLYAVAFRHAAGGESLEFVHPAFERLARERGFYSERLMDEVRQRGSIQQLSDIPEEVRRLFVTAHEVSVEWHVRMQSAFQKHTDNAISKTINLPNSASRGDISRAFRLAYDLGCLGITVFRDASKGAQVLTAGLEGADQAHAPAI